MAPGMKFIAIDHILSGGFWESFAPPPCLKWSAKGDSEWADFERTPEGSGGFQENATFYFMIV